MTNFLLLKSSWVKKVEDSIRNKPKLYLHFDKPFKRLDQKTIQIVTDKTYVGHHGFFPLLNYIQSNRVYKKDLNTGKRFVKRKPRPIAYASHLDSLIYSWYSFQIEQLYEEKLKNMSLTDVVIAYRKIGKSNIDFAKEIFDFVQSKDGYSSVNLDIQGFYDNLDHQLLKDIWKDVLKCKILPRDHYQVYKSIINYAYVRSRELKKVLRLRQESLKKTAEVFTQSVLDELRKNKKVKKYKKPFGIPQGTPISCVLSNIYMLEFDVTANKIVSEYGGIYRRYSDDIIFICPTIAREEVLNKLYEKINDLKLTIQRDKTEIRDFKKGTESQVCIDERGKKSKLQYLGVEFTGQTVLLRHKAYAKYERRLTATIRREVVKSKENKKPLSKSRIYRRYSPYREVVSYIDYALNASKKLNSPGIKQQVQPARIMKKISKKIKTAKGKKPHAK